MVLFELLLQVFLPLFTNVPTRNFGGVEATHEDIVENPDDLARDMRSRSHC